MRKSIHDEPIPIEEIDRIIHEPARLLILAHLSVVESLDFVLLMNLLKTTQGNLSSHLSKLENAKYIHIEKIFVSKRPRTMLSLTSLGQEAFQNYRTVLTRLVDLISE